MPSVMCHFPDEVYYENLRGQEIRVTMIEKRVLYQRMVMRVNWSQWLRWMIEMIILWELGYIRKVGQNLNALMSEFKAFKF